MRHPAPATALLLLVVACEAATARSPGADHAVAPQPPAAAVATTITTATATHVETRTPEPPGTHTATPAELGRYPWLRADAEVRPLSTAFTPPAGFQRVEIEPSSFGGWLRDLPLRPAGSPVHTYRGDVLREPGDPRVAAVAELDVAPRDLQQCADSVIRLHAEWLWASDRQRDIRYHTTSGDLAAWSRYAAGERPTIEPQKMTWAPAAKADGSRRAFGAYLDIVFGYAGTGSLATRAVKRERSSARPGDFFVLPGSPGHTILILDVAKDASGHSVALLGQGFMPAQDFHVLATRADPWFSLDAEAIDTPFWPAPFPWSSLRRLPD